MNNKLILDLTFRLSQALNNNYDVVDMDTVLCVISALEGATITKEQLETTRLGNYVNQLRRRTKSDQLARRSKNLLKKWREMVGIQHPPAVAGQPSTAIARSRPSSPSVQIISDSRMVGGSGDNSLSGADYRNNSNCSLTNHTGSANYTNKKTAKTNLANGGSVTTTAMAAAAVTKPSLTKQPTSFANLITGGSGVGIQQQSPAAAFLIDDNRSHSPHSLPPLLGGGLAPHNTKVEMLEVSRSPLSFHQPPHKSTSRQALSLAAVAGAGSQLNGAITIDLQDSNSALDKNDNRGEHRKSKKHKKERKQRKDGGGAVSGKRNSLAPIIADEHSLFPTASAECLSLSNSSLSIFPKQQLTSASAAATASSSAAATPPPKTDLTFAGKFSRQQPSLSSNNVIVLIESRSCSPFLPIGADGNDSCASSQLEGEVIDVVNQDNHTIINAAAQLAAAAASSSSSALLPTAVAAAATAPPTVPNDEAAAAKVPKKRGRKKGSKGVDGILAQSQTFLNTQLLESSKLLTSTGGGKKVKTTIELYADLKMRNNMGTSATSSPVLTQASMSRPPSTCSEPSLQSPSTSDACSTNATMSTVARSTPDKTVTSNFRQNEYIDDSASDSNLTAPLNRKATKLKIDPHIYIDIDSKSQQPIGNMAAMTAATAEEAINRLNAQLPPVNEDEIDWDPSPDVLCTCTIREIEPEIEPMDFTQLDEDSKPIISVDVIPLERKTDRKMAMQPHPSIATAAAAVTSPTAKPIRSIFDIDFDEEDYDPLPGFVAAEAAANKPKEDDETTSGETTDAAATTVQVDVAPPTIADHIRELKQVQLAVAAATTAATTQNDDNQLLFIQPVLPTYEVDEDPACEAKKRYDIDTNVVTQYHIDALHNCCIPSVNGNWDHAEPKNLDDEGQLQLVSYDEVRPDGLYVRVVPQYNHLVMDRLPKDLQHLEFAAKKFNKKKRAERKERSPLFLGVMTTARATAKDEAVVKMNKKLKKRKRRRKRLETEMATDAVTTTAKSEQGTSLIVISNKDNQCTVSDSQFSNSSNLITKPNAENNYIENVCDPIMAEHQTRSTSAANFNNNDLNRNDNNNTNPMVILAECERRERRRSGGSDCSNASLKTNQRVGASQTDGVVSSNSFVDDLTTTTTVVVSHTDGVVEIIDVDDDDDVVVTDVKLVAAKTARKRKRRKTSNDDDGKENKIKRIKIVNGHVKGVDDDDDVDETDELLMSSSDDDLDGEDDDGELDDEDDEADEDEEDDSSSNYGGGDEFHEVVSSSTTGNKHIVLTIKKTPNKMSSPSSQTMAAATMTAPSATTPPPAAAEPSSRKRLLKDEDEDKENVLKEIAEIELNGKLANKLNISNNTQSLRTPTQASVGSVCVTASLLPIPAHVTATTAAATPDHVVPSATIDHVVPSAISKMADICLQQRPLPPHAISVQAKAERLRRRDSRRKRKPADDMSAIPLKAHQKLFFAYELRPQKHDRLFNYSSSSSSSYESGSSSSDESDDEAVHERRGRGRASSSSSTDSSSSSGDSSSESESEKEDVKPTPLSPQKAEEADDDDEKPDVDPLPADNNHRLKSFDYINDHVASENRTGLRKVDEDVDDEDGNNCARIQQFKEWHEVLQVHSYNDELLTILPYVVID